jgi:hypothetical protein
MAYYLASAKPKSRSPSNPDGKSAQEGVRLDEPFWKDNDLLPGERPAS